MSQKKMKHRKTSDLFQAETLFGEFQRELTEIGSVNLSEWASEIPDELRDVVVPQLLAIYIQFCQHRGWTLHLTDFLERYPQFLSVIDPLKDRSGIDNNLQETISTYSLTASTKYAVIHRPWLEGGQGVLHKASDQGIGGRQVAVKFLKDSEQADDFQKEIEVTAKLEHPGVVAVFARGEEETPPNRPFYAMRLIHGQPLEEKISDFYSRIPTEKREARKTFDPARRYGIGPVLENIISACNTVSYAHSMGVLHCDLKPKNIVCGRFGATIVLDWGSARSYDMPESQTNDSSPPLNLPAETSRSFTLTYASPEQIAQKHVTPSSDVYSLGATLYQALTGRTPFGEDRRANSAFKSPREVNPRIPKRLAAICTKAMQPSPEDRYVSVDKFAKDLTNWLRDEEIIAAPDTLVEQGFRIARRYKHATITGLLALFALTVLGLVTWNIKDREHQVSQSLKSAMVLIEGLCQPLEKDEVENSTEFDERAMQVEQFAENYIQENSGTDTKLARAHELSGLVAFYRHNRTLLEDSKDHLQAAIRSLEKAERIYRSTSSDLLLAQNQVRQARWFRTLAAMEGKDNDSKRAAFRKLNEAVHILDSGLTPTNRGEEVERALAEAHHVKGEFLHRNMGALVLTATGDIERLEEGQDADTVEQNLRQSIACFTKAIDILSGYEQSRDLARGYGFRGDVEKSLGNYAEAFQDYKASLAIREDAWKADRSDENSFQLARGLVNFGMWMRDLADDVDLSQFMRDMIDDGEFREAPFEVRVCETYVQRALGFQRGLTKQGDDRPKVDYCWQCNVAAELYYFAANRPDISDKSRKGYLEQAGRFADMAIERYEDRLEGLPQNVRDILANSYMVKLQVARASGDQEENITEFAGHVNRLTDVHGAGFKKLADEPLLFHAVALATTQKSSYDLSRLQRVVAEMAKRGFGQDARVRKHLQHFDDEVLNVVLNAKNR